MDPSISRKISVLRFVAVASVVVFHAYPLAGGGFAEGFVSLALMRWALPFLGLISGYLFFRTFKPTVACYTKKLRSRLRSILLPFLIWSALAVLFAWATADPEYGGPVSSLGEGLYHWLLRPVASPLWFLQALLGCVALSPLVYVAVRRLRYWVLPLAVVWWVSGVQPDALGPWISAIAFPPFMTGAAIALLRPRLAWARRPAPAWLAAALGGAWIAAAALFALYGLELGVWLRAAMFPVVVLGALTLWSGYDVLTRALRGVTWLPAAALSVAPLSFFVYATQQPQLKVLMLLLERRAADLPDVIAYGVAPLLTMGFSLAAALVFRRLAPRAFALASGGRAAAARRRPAQPSLAAQEA